jgi:hypothetical protein
MMRHTDYDPLLTLNENLKVNGLTTRPTHVAGKKDILDSNGQVVLACCAAYEATFWLKENQNPADMPVSHDGGPDIADGAPSNGDLF